MTSWGNPEKVFLVLVNSKEETNQKKNPPTLAQVPKPKPQGIAFFLAPVRTLHLVDPRRSTLGYAENLSRVARGRSSRKSFAFLAVGTALSVGARKAACKGSSQCPLPVVYRQPSPHTHSCISRLPPSSLPLPTGAAASPCVGVSVVTMPCGIRAQQAELIAVITSSPTRPRV